MDHRLAYSKMSDHAPQELSRKQKDLVEEAVVALKAGLSVRGVPFLSEADLDARAYEALDGVRWQIIGSSSPKVVRAA